VLSILVICSCGESHLLVSWCAGDRCGIAGSDEDHGRSRRPGAEDRGWLNIGRVLSNRTIKRSGDAVCSLYHAQGDEERRFLSSSSKPRSTVCHLFGLKTTGTVYQWFDLKTTGTVSLGLTSKSVVTLSPDLASKLLATVSPSLASKLVASGFLICASKLTAMI
jgi:hypothetical protein